MTILIGIVLLIVGAVVGIWLDRFARYPSDDVAKIAQAIMRGRKQ
jgi:hypothetical protein